MLSNFQLGDQALLQSFLIGQPELRRMMQGVQMQQLRQRVIASYHLGPLDPGETRAYVEHRLRHVNWKDDPSFDPECFDLIHTYSNGIPRQINTLCNRLLLAAYLGEKHSLSVGDVQAVAREINEELGMESTRSAISVVGTAVNSTVDSTLPMRSEPKSWHRHLEHLDERMDRLERTVATAVDLLHRLLHPDKSGNEPGTGTRR